MEYTFGENTLLLFNNLKETSPMEYSVSEMTNDDVTVFLTVLQAKKLSDMDSIMNNPKLLERMISLAFLGDSANNLFRILAQQEEFEVVQSRFEDLKPAKTQKRLL